ncbi:MAG: putative lipid II flippase FtsW [Actinomycetota bacterium]|nr:putative lipid II flippase FtsW [Actinomycetota bacterium]
MSAKRRSAEASVGARERGVPDSLLEARKRRNGRAKARREGSPRRSSLRGAVKGGATATPAPGLTSGGYAILAVTLIMFLYGMVMIFSASSGLAFHIHGSSYYYLLRQAVWFGVGLIALVALALTDYHRVAKASPLIVLVSLVALAAVPFVGTEAYGSTRAIAIGPMVFQPSELAKMALVIYAAYMYEKRGRKPESWRDIFYPVLMVTALACILIIIEPDLGSMVIAGISVFAVLYLAGAPLSRLALLGVTGLGATAIFIVTSSYRKARFMAFMDPWSVPREGGFHIIQSMVALGSGSISGLGLGMSRQKFFYLPNAHTDFIFSIIGEELGIIGTLAVLTLFAVFICLGFKVARRAPDGLGRLMAMGIICMVGIQALVNMGAATGILPITGVTLPFFSYGGSSLVICMCLAGILINVSRQQAEMEISQDRRKARESGDMRRRHGRPPPPPSRSRRRTEVA